MTTLYLNHLPVNLTRNVFLVLILSSTCIFSGCKKLRLFPEYVEKLPAMTTEGKDTFGCLIDGEIFLPRGTFPMTPGLRKNVNPVTLELQVNRGSKSLNINVSHITNSGEYDLTTNMNSAEYYDGAEQYIATSGKVMIKTRDFMKEVLAGTFSFVLTNLKTGKTISVTDGRFDMKYGQ
ncbi:MAG: hypothetical protein EOO91_03485 [Pedobacter sp.]|nr:MAG: hypothetical protein EOO91_03485 [Pedobacter sp.]